ncbi:MAG: TonB-dependent receptor [Pyrinomonadaceae bacterium]|nr:TonB-dependent receptor [Pyrinomonadaceae bacterium]
MSNEGVGWRWTSSEVMISKILVSVYFLFVLVVATAGQSATGTVLDINGDAVANASINITALDSRVSSKTKSGPAGEFVVSVPKSESYRLVVRAQGFAVFEKTLLGTATDGIGIVLSPENVAEVVAVSSSFLAGTQSALERTPGSIQTISKRELKDSRVFNFSEALRKVSGVSIRNEEGFGLRPNISIRGSNPTRSRKVLLLEDGIPLAYAPYGDNSSYYHPPIERFETVEVLKGSGQISHGPVTVAGVVNYLTPNPPSAPKFTINVTGGNRDYFNGSAGFGTTIGNTGIITNFTRKQGLGSRENIRAGVNDFSTKVIHTINHLNVLTFKYSHFDESSTVTYSGLTEEEFAQNPRQNPFRNDDLEFFREGFSVSHSGVINQFSSITTTFYTSYFSRDWWRQSSNSSQRPNRLGSDPDCTGMADLNTTCGNQGTPRDFRTFGVEPRFSSSFETGPIRNAFTAGMRVHYETQNRRKYNGDTPFSRAEGSQQTEANLRNALAFSTFVQNRFLWKNFSVTPGLRIEKIRYERSNLLNGATAKTTTTQFIPGVGVAYNPFSNTTIFAGVHRGFAPPSTSDILTNSGGVVELDSELSWNYEAGIRTRPVNYLSLEAAFFRNDYENQIIPASVAGGQGAAATNAGATLQQGFEFNGRLDTASIFKSDFNIYLRSAYTNLSIAEFRALRFSGISGSTDILVSGNRLPYVPKHLATSSIGFEYRGFHAFVENNFVSSQFTDDLNTIVRIENGQRGQIASQSYFNATANYRVERWKSTIFITVKNAADKLHIVDRTRGIYPGIPRLIQTGIKIDF